MKIKCFYYDGDLMFPWSRIINREKYDINYSKYLLALITFISKNETTFIIENIKKVEKKEIEVFERLIELPDIYIYIMIK